MTHGHPVRRVNEVMKWVHSGEYDRIVRGDYRTREESADARAEAGAAFDFYVERFRGLFKDAGAGVERAGDRVTEAAGKMAEWLRGGRG